MASNILRAIFILYITKSSHNLVTTISGFCEIQIAFIPTNYSVPTLSPQNNHQFNH